MPITLINRASFHPLSHHPQLLFGSAYILLRDQQENISYPLNNKQERQQLLASAEGLLRELVPERGLAGPSCRTLSSSPHMAKWAVRNLAHFVLSLLEGDYYFNNPFSQCRRAAIRRVLLFRFLTERAYQRGGVCACSFVREIMD